MIQATIISLFERYINYKRNRFGVVLLLTCFFVINNAKGQDMKLWYNEPAKAWVEALPLGN